MHPKLNIAVLIYLLFAGCSASKIPYQSFIESNVDSVFLSTYVQGNMTGYVECLGYQSKGYESLSESLNEDVKQAGLILNARSNLSLSNKLRAVFGNETTSCTLLFSRTMNNTRHGRSALTSVLNLVSNVKGEPYTPQDEPDTLLTSAVYDGSIMLNDRISGFYFNRNYKKNLFDGWLVLNGDTVIARQVKDDRDEKGKLLGDTWSYSYWLELVKNGTTYAALYMDAAAKLKLYILRNLGETEKMLIAAYLAVIVYRS